MLKGRQVHSMRNASMQNIGIRIWWRNSNLKEAQLGGQY